MGRWFTIIPFLGLPVLIYVLIALFSFGAGETNLPAIAPKLESSLFALPMISGTVWQFQLGDLILLLGLITLAIEIMKSTSTKSTALANHATSLGLMIFCVILFLVFSNFSTSVFFFLTMMTVLDVLAGVMVSIVSARRDFGVGDGFGG